MNLREAAEQLHCRQIAAVKLMADNFAALARVESRRIKVGRMEITILHNPARAISSAARVDNASIASRPCFLCASNRLQGQQAVQCLEGRYDLLVNPYPIFSRHFVIASRHHERQAIAGRASHLWTLARELHGYTVFYNGPRCGASAPDHMHFQAVPSLALPIWDALRQGTAGLPIDITIIDAATPAEAQIKLYELMPSLPVGDPDEWEPRMNLLATASDTGVRFAVVPRPLHRPAIFTADPTDPTGMTVSPASVDAAGVMVLPRRIDFDRIDRDSLTEIYNETCRF